MAVRHEGGAAPWAGARLEIETPEHVSFDFELAGAGSRFVAFLLDALILVLANGIWIVTMVWFGVFGVGMILPGGLPAVAALLLLGSFTITWGYFIFFEGTRNGQTPGKKAFGLRVVHEGGHPLTLRGAVIRNLVRFVDIQPMPSCLVGGISILLHPRAQRPGDLAAGTVVVREQPTALLPEEAAPSAPGARPRLSDEEYRVLNEYVLRRPTLEQAARRRVASRLLPAFAHFAEGEESAWGGAEGAVHPSAADALLLRIHGRESAARSGAGGRSGAGSPSAAALVRRQRERWDAFSTLLERAQRRGLSGLPESDVARFASLYRELAADLARARTYGGSPALIQTLERSVAAGHNLLYVRRSRSPSHALLWLVGGFPALVRRRALPILIAGVVLYLPALIAFGAVATDPERAHAVVPADMIARAEAGAERQAEGTGYVEIPEVLMPLFSSQIIANNVQVSLLAFAGGIAAGMGTILILILNGVMLGGVAGLFHVEGLSLYLWSFVLPHGVIELTAICIAGGAGLLLGSALLVPGRMTRGAALRTRAKDAVALLGGVVFLLLVAGLIEGFISPSRLPDSVKLTVGALTALGLFPWLLLSEPRSHSYSRHGSRGPRHGSQPFRTPRP